MKGEGVPLRHRAVRGGEDGGARGQEALPGRGGHPARLVSELRKRRLVGFSVL